MGLLNNMLNLSNYVECARHEMSADEMATIASAEITTRDGEFGEWKTLDVITTDGASLSGKLSPLCKKSGKVDIKNCKIFLTKVKKAGSPDTTALDRWVVE